MTAPLKLLEEAARVLREDTAPTLSGEPRYRSLLAAKAIDTARRELALAARLAALEESLPKTSEAFRDGTHDDDAALYGRLLEAAILRAHVADPDALTASERSRLEALAR